MILFENDTSFRALTAPGYFNFSDSQSADTAKYVAWFDALTDYIKLHAIRFDNFFRLWKTFDYSSCTINRTPYVEYLLRLYGIQWFNGSDEDAVKVIGLVSRSYVQSTIANLQYLLTALSQVPLSWTNGIAQVASGGKKPAIFAENLIIFSTSVGLPATPAPQVYPDKSWISPVGWTKQPSSATYLSRGYLSSGNIVWSAPISTSTAFKYTTVSTLGTLPGTPSTGDVAIVADDSSGDYGSVYYYDGSTWRKNSTPNSYQGSVGQVDARAVFAPDPDTTQISSSIQPPVLGPSQGYGIYGSLSTFEIGTLQIYILVDLTTEGNNNLSIIMYLLRKLKPTIDRMFLNYSINGVGEYQVEIFDSGAVT